MHEIALARNRFLLVLGCEHIAIAGLNLAEFHQRKALFVESVAFIALVEQTIADRDLLVPGGDRGEAELVEATAQEERASEIRFVQPLHDNNDRPNC
jgi:hypothetical protein